MRKFFKRSPQSSNDYKQVPQSDPDRTPPPQYNDSFFDYDKSGEVKVHRRSSKSSSVASTQKGDLARSRRSTSGGSSTASSISCTPIERAWARPQVEPLPASDAGSGTRSYTHTKPIQVLNMFSSGWAKQPPRSVYGKWSLAVNPILRGQPFCQQSPTGELAFKAIPLYLVDNPAPGSKPSKRQAHAETSWLAYFNKTYPGWDLAKPDWRGEEYITLQRKRLYSSLEMYDLRYSKFRTKVCVYGYKLRIKSL